MIVSLEPKNKNLETKLKLHLLAGLLKHGQVVGEGEKLRLGGLALLGHVVEQVEAWPVGPNVCQLVQRGNLHTGRIARVAALWD